MNARKLPRVPGMLRRAVFKAGISARAGIPVATGWAIAVAAAVACGPAAGQEVKGDAKAAERKVGACMGCHGIPGYRSSYPMVYSVPMINGQTSKYIENSLNAYRSGDRSHPTMRAIAGSLSDQDIADLAAYYGKPLESK
jgi:cytochrome c553